MTGYALRVGETETQQDRVQKLIDSTAGTAGASSPLVVDADKNLTWSTTSSSTSGSSSVEPLSMTNVMTGAGGVGGRAKFKLETNVALGGWANAVKAHTEFGASGRVTGLGSALVAELQLSAGTTQGTYAPLESEIVMPSGASTGTATSFLYGAASGAAVGTFDDNGFFFELAGLTAGAAHVFAANSKTGIAMTHTLRCRIGGTTYYLALHTDANHGGS